jgi:hypothetical protein
MYVLGARVVCRCLAEGDGTQVVLANRHWLRQVLRIEVLQQLLSVGALVLWSLHLARGAPTRWTSEKWVSAWMPGWCFAFFVDSRSRMPVSHVGVGISAPSSAIYTQHTNHQPTATGDPQRNGRALNSSRWVLGRSGPAALF